MRCPRLGTFGPITLSRPNDGAGIPGLVAASVVSTLDLFADGHEAK